MAVDPFLVALGELRDRRGARHVVRRAEIPEALVADVDSRVPAGTEVVADVVLDAFDGGVAVSGTVTARWEGECRRCLSSIDGDLVADVKDIFRKGGGPGEGTYPLTTEHVNLRELVMDALFVSLPLLPLCRQDCKGICPLCGADLNSAPCECREVQVDPRWAGLSALRSAPDEGGARGDDLGPRLD
jgi:uncharacterized protein